jgi:tellurite resistance protein TerC
MIFLIIDLYTHKNDHAISLKNALYWSIFWIILSVIFSIYIGYSYGSDSAYLFLSGYLLEKSLSVDNLFVIMAIFSSFAIKDALQHRILYFGILGALILRMLFIALGSSLILLFGSYALAAFGLFVLWSAWKMWQHMGSDEEDIVNYSNHWAISATRHFFPVHNFMQGHDFFVKVQENSKSIWKATPLFLCLVVVEISDIIFAFDSVPAIIAITQEPFLVYTSNIFAILGLRSLYFLLVAAKRHLCHLEKSVIIILIYIGIKMLLDVFYLVHIHAMINLVVVFGLLICGIISSFLFPEKS